MKAFLLMLFFAMASVPNTSSEPTVSKPAPVKVEEIPTSEADRILYYAMKNTFVRETKGYNRSPEIDLWNKYTGAAMGSPYCASFVSYMHKLANVKGPVSAWSPDCVSKNNVKFADVKPGDVFGMYFSSKGRVAHTGFIRGVSGNLVRTAEANTSPDATSGSSSDRDGDGAWAKTRSKFLMENSKNKYSRYWK